MIDHSLGHACGAVSQSHTWSVRYTMLSLSLGSGSAHVVLASTNPCILKHSRKHFAAFEEEHPFVQHLKPCKPNPASSHATGDEATQPFLGYELTFDTYNYSPFPSIL